MRLNGIMNKINAVERRITDKKQGFISNISIERLSEKYNVTDAERSDNSELSQRTDKIMNKVLLHAKEWRERRR